MPISIHSLPLNWIPFADAARGLGIEPRALLELGVQNHIQVFALVLPVQGREYRLPACEGDPEPAVCELSMSYYELFESDIFRLMHEGVCVTNKFRNSMDRFRYVLEEPVQLTLDQVYLDEFAMSQVRDWHFEALAPAHPITPLTPATPATQRENTKQLNSLRRLVGVLCHLLVDVKNKQEYWVSATGLNLSLIASDVQEQIQEMKLDPVGLREENLRKMLRQAQDELDNTARVQAV